MTDLLQECRGSSEASSKTLKAQILVQLPALKRKFAAEFSRIYYTGIWVRLKQYIPVSFLPSPRSTIYQQEDPNPIQSVQQSVEFSVQTPSLNREEMPIRPLKVAYQEIAQQNAQASNPSPAPAKTNFLKKGANTKYNPTQSIKQAKQDIKISQEQLSELPDQNFQEPEVKFAYLKRTSKTYQPAQLSWKENAKSRIDCWGSIQQNTVTSPPVQTVFNLDNSLALNVLEDTFDDLIAGHVPSSEYFESPDRNFQSRVPQFSTGSFFITHYTDEIYQEMLQALDNHYNYLCSDEFTQDQQ